MAYETQDTWCDASEADRDTAWNDAHPRCARCEVIICRCDGSCGESDDGFQRHGVWFCGLTCADAFEQGTPAEVAEDVTTPIPVVVGDCAYPSIKAWRKGVA